jgi:hypothetical protein
VVKDASAVYGFFGFVLGLLAWIYLGAQLTLYAAEINVVRVDRLWPRSLLMKPPLEEADRQTLRKAAEVEERIPEEDVAVSFDPEAGGEQPARRGVDGERPSRRERRSGFARAAGLGAVAGGLIGAALGLRRRPEERDDS